MSKPMKYHPHGSVLFCTFSNEEGLLLLSTSLCLALIKSCLAAAQHHLKGYKLPWLYPLRASLEATFRLGKMTELLA
jgi:hypothetical protein